jgi:hypothetical protein
MTTLYAPAGQDADDGFVTPARGSQDDLARAC